MFYYDFALHMYSVVQESSLPDPAVWGRIVFGGLVSVPTARSERMCSVVSRG